MATPKENKDLIKEFYKGINKKKAGYEYSPTGELLIKNKSGEVAKTVTLPTYRSPTETELVEQETKRFDAILAAEKVFEEARDASRRAELPSEIKHAMRAVELADQALQRVRYPLTQVSIYESIPIKSILFEMKKDEHKIKDVFAFVGRPFTLEEYYVRSTPLSPLPESPLAPFRKYFDPSILSDPLQPDFQYPVQSPKRCRLYLQAAHILLVSLRSVITFHPILDVS